MARQYRESIDVSGSKKSFEWTRIEHPNAVKSANWTWVGLWAHESALAGGKIVRLPAFTL